jgi:hypothetical protein
MGVENASTAPGANVVQFQFQYECNNQAWNGLPFTP